MKDQGMWVSLLVANWILLGISIVGIVNAVRHLLAHP